jgi:hypothetical protein
MIQININADPLVIPAALNSRRAGRTGGAFSPTELVIQRLQVLDESKSTGLPASRAPAGLLFERSARFALVLPSQE